MHLDPTGRKSNPFVSVIIPCRNEAAFISSCLDSILSGDYPADHFEIIVADGMSDDDSRRIVAGSAVRHPQIRLIENRGRIAASALNGAVRVARGEIVVRMDAHAFYPSDYISRCVHWLRETGADAVGGIRRTRPRGPGIVARTIAASEDSPAGNGKAAYRSGTASVQAVDTLFAPAFRKEVIDRLGGFNEQTPRSEDVELFRWLTRQGGRILLVPDIMSYYYVRTDPFSYLSHKALDGYDTFMAIRHARVLPLRLRHVVPVIFWMLLAGASIGSVCGFVPSWGAMGLAAVYGLAIFAAGVTLAVRHRSVGMGLIAPLVFAAAHACYAVGSFCGIVRLMIPGRHAPLKKSYR